MITIKYEIPNFIIYVSDDSMFRKITLCIQLSDSNSHCTWRPSQITIANFKYMNTSDRNSLPILIAVNGRYMRVWSGPPNRTDKPIRRSQNLDRHIQLSEMKIPVDGAHVKLP